MRRGGILCAAAAAAAVVSGCGGGGESARQDADEPRGTYTVDVDASFPRQQALAKQERMRISVRNTDSKTIPNVAVTVDSFAARSKQTNLADPSRPTWVVDSGPRGGVTAYTNTWALGKIRPGQTKTFEWRATPVKAGTYRLKYRVAAGLDGKAKARLEGGSKPEGSFRVRVSGEPSQSRVDPDSGRVIRE
jgi:hypothetical protein